MTPEESFKFMTPEQQESLRRRGQAPAAAPPSDYIPTTAAAVAARTGELPNPYIRPADLGRAMAAQTQTEQMAGVPAAAPREGGVKRQGHAWATPGGAMRGFEYTDFTGGDPGTDDEYGKLDRVAKRVFQNINAQDPQALQTAVAQFKQMGLNPQIVGEGLIDFGLGEGPIRVLNNGSWDWKTLALRENGGTGRAPTTSSGRPMWTDLYATTPDRQALLDLLDGGVRASGGRDGMSMLSLFPTGNQERRATLDELDRR